MTDIWFAAIISVLAVSAISLIGIFTLSVKTKLLNRALFVFVSFAAGAMLGDAFIHLLPEAVEEKGFTIEVSLSILLGIAILFLVEKVIHWRHCHHTPTEHHVHPFAIMNLLGDSVHNFIDGLIIGASYLVSIPIGIATTIAVILHEIPQEISDFAVLVHGGFTKGKALFLNLVTALVAVLGVVVALLIGFRAESFASLLVPFAAGSFIYILSADLIPEIHKEVRLRKSIVQFIAFLLGIGIMLALLWLE